MDGETFDRMMKRLRTDGSRREMLGGILGAAAAIVTGAALGHSTAEAKPGKGNGRGRGNGGNGKGKGKGNTKVTLCHKSGNGTFSPITVGAPASKGHLKHGDVLCELATCQVATACDAVGACTVGNAPNGTSCVTDTGASGHCTDGTCAVG
jgi:hypothetical protein